MPLHIFGGVSVTKVFTRILIDMLKKGYNRSGKSAEKDNKKSSDSNVRNKLESLGLFSWKKVIERKQDENI